MFKTNCMSKFMTSNSLPEIWNIIYIRSIFIFRISIKRIQSNMNRFKAISYISKILAWIV